MVTLCSGPGDALTAGLADCALATLSAVCCALVTAVLVSPNCCCSCWIFCWSCSCVFWSCSWVCSSFCTLSPNCSTTFFKALKSSALTWAEAGWGRAAPITQAAATVPKIKEGIFMGGILGCLVSAVFLEIFQDLPGLRRGKVGPDPHVRHDRLPLGRGKLGGIPFRVTPIAVDLIQLGAGEFLSLRPFGRLGRGHFKFRGLSDGRICVRPRDDGRRENDQGQQCEENPRTPCQLD